MAYESKVTNKYFGTTFAGTGKVVADTELGQVVNALKSTFSPAAQGFGESYIEKKQSEAGVKMQELYAKHGKDTLKEVMSGKHPELESMYATATKEVHLGKFAASDAYLKYKENLSEYNPDTQDLNSFMSSFVPEGLESNGKFFASGFGATWNSFTATELSADATQRADRAKERVMNEYTTIGSTWSDNIGINYYDFTYGVKGEVSNHLRNEYTRNHVSVETDKAKSLKDIANIEKIFYEDRGDGKNMLTSGSEKDSALWAQLQTAKTSLIVSGQKRKSIQDKLIEADILTAYGSILLGKTADYKGQLITPIDAEKGIDAEYQKQELISFALKKGMGELINKISKLETSENNLTDNGLMESLKLDALKGNLQYLSSKELMDRVTEAGGGFKGFQDIQNIVKNRQDDIANGAKHDPRNGDVYKAYLDGRSKIENTSNTFPALWALNNARLREAIISQLNAADGDAILAWSAVEENRPPAPTSPEYIGWLQKQREFIKTLEANRTALLQDKSIIKGMAELAGKGENSSIDSLTKVAEETYLNNKNINYETVMRLATKSLMTPREIIDIMMKNTENDAFTAIDKIDDRDLAGMMGEDLAIKIGINPEDIQQIMNLREDFTTSINDFVDINNVKITPAQEKKIGELLTNDEAAASFPKLRTFLDTYYTQMSPYLTGSNMKNVIQLITPTQWQNLATNIGLNSDELKQLTEEIYNFEIKGE